MKLLLLTLLIAFTFCLADENAPNWSTIRRRLQVNGNKGFGAVDYSTSARQVRGDVECTNTCDIYLMTELEFNKLRKGQGFNYIQGRTGVTSLKFTLINDRDVIARHLFAVVVNTGAFSLDATWVLEQDVAPANPFATLLALILLAPCICCCCALFIVCGIIGALRNMILDFLGIRRGGYTQFGSGGYNAGYSGSSSGGNTYSGTIGGGSSSGYGSSSSGGNTYSGSI